MDTSRSSPFLFIKANHPTPAAPTQLSAAHPPARSQPRAWRVTVLVAETVRRCSDSTQHTMWDMCAWPIDCVLEVLVVLHRREMVDGHQSRKYVDNYTLHRAHGVKGGGRRASMRMRMRLHAFAASQRARSTIFNTRGGLRCG